MGHFLSMNAPQGELLAAVSRVVAGFEILGIEYRINGSVASSVFGESRQMMDADLVAAISGKHAKPLVDGLGSEFYVDGDAILEGVENQSWFNMIHLESMTKVDVFASARTAIGHSQLLRNQKIAMADSVPPLFFDSPEDAILA